MPVQWYYQNREGDVGPVSLAELRYLFNVGTITASTLVRSGEESLWRTAGSIADLLEPGRDAGNGHESASESPEWHFNLKGQSKQGPVTWSALKRDDRRRSASARRTSLEAWNGTVGAGVSGSGASGGIVTRRA